MLFASPLITGVLVQRYKRFLADVVLDDGQAATAHCANPGAMLGLTAPGSRVWLSRSDSKTRKLPLSLEMIEADGVLVGVNTHLPNKLVAEALAARAIPELAGYVSVRPEVKYGQASRIDFLLGYPDGGRLWLEVKNEPRKDSPKRLWLEVKNVHLSRTKGLAEFPDCVAARSAKHLRELQAMVEAGDRAAVLFVVQREDCEAFAACRDIDPKFAGALDEAADVGVEVLIYQCAMSTEEIQITRRVDWRR